MSFINGFLRIFHAVRYAPSTAFAWNVFKLAYKTMRALIISTMILMLINFSANLFHKFVYGGIKLSPGISQHVENNGKTLVCNRLPLKVFWAKYPRGRGTDPLFDTFEFKNQQVMPPDIFDDVNNSKSSRRVSGYFSALAAVAANTYYNPEIVPFRLDKKKQRHGEWVYDKENRGDWKFVQKIRRRGGFQADVYRMVLSESKTKVIIVAFRGTDGWSSFWDVVSNLDWLFGYFNPWDQYTTSRKVMGKLQRDLLGKKDASDDELKELRQWLWSDDSYKFSFMAVGHSLGGGLAEHVSMAFPCTAAATFDKSFVTNRFRIARPFRNQQVSIYEDGDPLTFIWTSLFPYERKDVTFLRQFYRLNNISDGESQHNIVRLAAGMSRNSVCGFLEKLHKRDEEKEWIPLEDSFKDYFSEKVWCNQNRPVVRYDRVDIDDDQAAKVTRDEKHIKKMCAPLARGATKTVIDFKSFGC